MENNVKTWTKEFMGAPVRVYQGVFPEIGPAQVTLFDGIDSMKAMDVPNPERALPVILATHSGEFKGKWIPATTEQGQIEPSGYMLTIEGIDLLTKLLEVGVPVGRLN